MIAMGRPRSLRLTAPFLLVTLLAAAEPPRDFRDATVAWPVPVAPPAGAPNVLIVLWDDIGFGQFGAFGSPLTTPNIDRVAARGVRYTNFHTAPVCSPTRAALLTGRNPHAVGVNHIGEYANGADNSQGGPKLEAGTIADYLRGRGYGTFAIGKWHLAPMTEQGADASSAFWPTGRGFDHFYGYMGGDMNQFSPEIFSDRTRIKPAATRPAGETYFMDADFTDRAIGLIAEHHASAPAERPFFLYLAYCAGHAPHHAPPEYLAKWRGKFDAGWDVIRAETLARQKKMGLVPPDTALPPHNAGVKPWADLTPDQRRLFARYYEAFAADLEYVDAQFGRLLDYLDRSGLTDNTLILLASDNGASPEGGVEGIWNEMRIFAANQPGELAGGLRHYEDLGGPLTYPTYPIGWTQAGNTPFRGTKGTTFEGGVHVPLIASWPARIKDIGSLRPQYLHVVDIMPTILEAAGIAAPAVLQGRTQPPLAGTSFASTWPAAAVAAPAQRDTQYYEIHGHRAIYHQGWKAVTFHQEGKPYAEDQWELYNLTTDVNETRNLAPAQPAKLAELLAVWEQEAQRHNVYPLDDRHAGPRDMLRPEYNLNRTSITYYPPVSGLHKFTALERRNRSMTIKADIERDAAGEGVILAHGGRFAGYTLYVKAGRLCYHYNYAGDQRTAVTSDAPLTAGRHTVSAELKLTGDGGADVTLTIDGHPAGRGRVPVVLPGNISHETLDLGCDLYTPVADDYASPYNFQGTVHRVTVDTTELKK